MSRRANLIIALMLAVALVVTVLVWRAGHNGERKLDSVLASPLEAPAVGISPLTPPTPTPLPVREPVPPTGTPPVTQATLEAIRATRPTATPPSASGIQLPYVSPGAWRGWALRVMALAGVLAYIGWRLRQRQ